MSGDHRLPEWIGVGRVLGVHGVRGEVAIEVQTDTAERFSVGSQVWAGERCLEVAACRRHKAALLVAFVDVPDRDSAAELKGQQLVVPRLLVPPAPDGEFYYFELEGCEVVDRQEGPLGTVLQVHEDGGGLILEVSLFRDARARRFLPEGESPCSASAAVLVPFVKAHLRRVDVQGRLIETDLPAGLVELCVSTS